MLTHNPLVAFIPTKDTKRARRFYEARGFRAIRFTDGAGNEEKTPDVRYRWERAADG